MTDERGGGQETDLEASTPISFMSRRNSWDLRTLAHSLLERYKKGEAVDNELNAVAEELTEREEFLSIVIRENGRPKFQLIHGKKS